MRIVELPFEFCTGQHPALAVLVHRTDGLQVRHDIYLGDSYSFSGAVEASSYQLLASHNRFAQHGFIVSDYPATTLTIDQELGLVVLLDGADTILDEQSAFNALADDLMVFVGAEIMSVVSVQLVSANIYRLHVIRERMATPRQAHASGADVYLIARANLLPLNHRSFNVDNEVSLKVAMATGRFAQDLADVDASTLTIAGQVFTQTAPLNLRVQGNSRNATYTAGTDLRLDWSLHELRSGIAAQFGVKLRTQIEIISLSDAFAPYSKLTYGQHFKIAAAKMASIIGAEPAFLVKLTTDILGSNLRLQSNTIQITVEIP